MDPARSYKISPDTGSGSCMKDLMVKGGSYKILQDLSILYERSDGQARSYRGIVRLHNILHTIRS